jgi:hypothetical protein
MTRSKPKGRQTHKRGAEEDSSNSRRSKRRAAEHGSEAAALAQQVATPSDAGQVKDNHMEIKDEPAGDINQELPPTAGPSNVAIHHARSPSVHTPARNVLGDQSTQAADRENVLDTLLSQDFNAEMTRHAVQQILQDARESAGSDNELGVAYVEARCRICRSSDLPTAANGHSAVSSERSRPSLPNGLARSPRSIVFSHRIHW